MFPYQRLHDLFNYIYSNDMVLPAKIATYLNVSVRTIRSDITIINKILNKHGGEIILKRNFGYSIIVHQSEPFTNFLNNIKKQSTLTIDLETTENRIRHITNILLLQNDYISIEEISNTVFVGINTLQNYLKSIAKKLEIYHLELINRSDVGVKIMGDEKAKRRCITDLFHKIDPDDFVSVFSNDEYYFFKDYDLDALRQQILDIFIDENISITDMNLKNLITHIALLLLRIKDNHYINFTNISNINPQYQKSLDRIIDFLQNKYDIYISEGEKEYLYIHIISNTDCNILDISDHDIDILIDQFLECIYHDYSFDLRNDSILKEDLLKHMVSILSTKVINPDKKNPLLNTIKSNFPLPFEISIMCIQKVFAGSEFHLDEDDAGYISLHIGAAIERCFSCKYKAKNVILVCDGSHATARILEARLQNYYSNKINIVAIRSCAQISALSKEDFNNIHFIIATASIQVDNCPVVIVDFTLKTQDIESISKMLNIILSKDNNENTYFFDENLCILNTSYSDKQTLLTDMTKLLIKEDIVDEHFFKSVIDREKLAKTNINDIFAFPHAMKFYAKKTKVVVALLEQPIKWTGEETVQIIFLLATKKNQNKDIDKLYNIVVEIVNNPSLQKKILKSKTYTDFINALPKFQ